MDEEFAKSLKALGEAGDRASTERLAKLAAIEMNSDLMRKTLGLLAEKVYADMFAPVKDNETVSSQYYELWLKWTRLGTQVLDLTYPK